VSETFCFKLKTVRWAMSRIVQNYYYVIPIHFFFVDVQRGSRIKLAYHSFEIIVYGSIILV
jgi:hypothetical protein